MSQTLKSEQPVPVGALAPFHDHRWHEVFAEADTYEVFVCNECGVVWRS